MPVAIIALLTLAMMSDAPKPSPLPGDVLAFIDRRNDCEHWLGESAENDEKRAREINEARAKTCTGTDAELARLRKAYKSNIAVTAALADYEDTIETQP